MSSRCRKRWIIAAKELNPLPLKSGTDRLGSRRKQISSDELTTVGHRRLIRLKSPVTTSQVRIRITGSRLEPTLAEIGLFKQSASALPPAISDRDANGLVTLNNSAGCRMVYTTDGTTPTTNSAVYRSPLALPSGGTVQAACLLPNGRLGIMASKILRRSVADRLESCQPWTARKPPGETTPQPTRLTATRPPSGTPVGMTI